MADEEDNEDTMSLTDEEVASALFQLNFTLPNGQKVTGSFEADTKIDYDSLEEQLAETPAKYAFWSALLGEQKYAVSVLEKQVARRRSKLCEGFQASAQDEGIKLAKHVIDEMVQADTIMFELEARLLQANRTLSKLWVIENALKMKSEHLRSLAGFKREEKRLA